MAGHDQALRFEEDNPTRSDPRLEEIGRRVAEHSDRRTMQFQFRVLKEKQPLNAFSLLGGHIYITAGFLEKGAFTDDELAALLGHEIAHAAFRHVAEEFLEQWFLNYHAQALCNAPTDAGTVVGAVQALRERLGQDRHTQELLADQYGSLYANRAGFEFRGGYQLMEKVAGLRKNQTEETFGNRPDARGTHPPFSERVKQIQKTQALVLQVATDFGSGNDFFLKSRFQEAAVVFESILGVLPDSHNARLNLGASLHALYREKKEAAQPAPELRIAASIEVETLRNITLRGFESIGDPLLLEKARLHYRAILDDEPDNVAARNNLAATFFDEDDYDGCIAELELLAGRPPVPAMVNRNLGLCYYWKSEEFQGQDEVLWQERAIGVLRPYSLQTPEDDSVRDVLDWIASDRSTSSEG
jgi:tetratricopeptide (TPR) repeat protein